MMIKNLLLFPLIVLSWSQLCAQVELTRQVIGTLGGTTQLGGQVNISYTGGEAVIQTISLDDAALTQGFLQPGPVAPLSYTLELTATSCIDANDGSAQVKNLFGCVSPYTIAWSNGDFGNTVYDLAPGMYSVTVSTASCILTQEFEIIRGSEAACEVIFLNAFSPNDDGINDTWVIQNIEGEAFQDNSVDIFNRWGEMIWSAKNYDNSSVVWDGLTDKGIRLISGTYFYIATVNEKLYKGYIEITR
jgi:gliding motility-associated-like protein